MGRLFEELMEVYTYEFHDIPIKKPAADELEHHYGLELADCLAWTIGVANVKGIDLEKVTLERFWPTCWHCGSKPCRCNSFSMAEVHLDEITIKNSHRQI